MDFPHLADIRDFQERVAPSKREGKPAQGVCPDREVSDFSRLPSVDPFPQPKRKAQQREPLALEIANVLLLLCGGIGALFAFVYFILFVLVTIAGSPN